jgi:hypothetical protein
MKSNLAIDRLEDYLEDERQAIRTAKLDRLFKLEKERKTVLDGLGTLNGDPVRLQKLRLRARRNGELMQAAASGIRSAIRRIEELQRATGPINSYSAEGKPRSIGTNNYTIERKA